MLWNNVYTVKSYIPRVQKNSLSDYDYYSGIKGVNKKNAEDKNAFPYNKLKLKYNVTTAGIFRYIKDNFNVNDINFWYAIRQKTLLPNVNSVLESVMEEMMEFRWIFTMIGLMVYCISRCGFGELEKEQV